jgi:hypothetical protein
VSFIFTMLRTNLRAQRNKTRNCNHVLPIVERLMSTVEKKRQKILDRKQKNVIKQEALDELIKLRAISGGRAQYGDIPYIVNKYHNMGYLYITRGVLCYLLSDRHSVPMGDIIMQHKHMESSDSSRISRLTDDSLLAHDSEIGTSSFQVDASNTNDDNGFVSKTKAGRNETKAKVLTKKKAALTEASIRFHSAQVRAKLEGKNCVPRGTLNEIVLSVESEHSLSGGSLSSHSVVNRARRNNLEGTAHQRISPIHNLEPLIVEYCLRLARIGSPIDKQQLLLLTSSLIEGTDYSTKLITFKEKRGITVDLDNLIGKRWYLNFMRRNKDKVRKGRGKIRDAKRHTWCTHDAFEDMYNSVYTTMAEVGICKLLPDPVMLDINGNVVNEIEKMYGRPTNYLLQHPEMIVFVDETGSNTCQTIDGHVGGQLFILPKDGSSKGIVGSVTDMHFTVLPFISGTGEAIMCAIILKSEKPIEEIPLSWRYGIDITKSVHHHEGEDIEIFIKNSGEGTAMAGGPSCSFRGKEIPCFVCTSPKASISSQLLADMLSFIDSFNIFDRSNGKKPFLLLDGHHSRMDLPFLDYIHNANHEWACCIGVPYATHIWQVADSPQLNGSFKTELTRAKRRFFDIKSQRGHQNFEMTDIVPLVAHAWTKSFGVVQNAKTSIAHRGWGPLNFVLLDHPDVRKIVHNESATNQQQQTTETSSFNFRSVNTTEGFAGNILEKIVSEHIKDSAKLQQ